MLRSEGAAVKRPKTAYVAAGAITLAMSVPVLCIALATGIYSLLESKKHGTLIARAARTIRQICWSAGIRS